MVLLYCSKFDVFKPYFTQKAKLLHAITQTEAGKPIAIQIKSSKKLELYCSNSYGATIIEATKLQDTLTFNVPKPLVNKAGILNWQLVGTDIHGQIKITPQKQAKQLETYIGPPSILAGSKTHSTIVVLPTDSLDNVLKNGTPLNINNQFENNITKSSHKITNGIVFSNIVATNKTGRILASSSCNNVQSKAYDINILPALPTNFNIQAKRVHNYADANQITTLTTSVIKDKYNNVVANGTLVTFVIIGKNGLITKTFGNTINGVATAKLLHPEHPEHYKIKAHINNMASSQTLSLEYKPAILDFDVKEITNRTTRVGPILSFMNQKIPDGLPVIMRFYFKDKAVTFKNQTKDGYTTFIIPKERIPKGVYNIEIEAGGIIKNYCRAKIED